MGIGIVIVIVKQRGESSKTVETPITAVHLVQELNTEQEMK